LVLKAISLLKNIGISVDGIVCDGATTNRKIWSELGIVCSQDGMKNYFEHPSIHNNKRVYAFSDFIHLFKWVRNRLYNNKTLRVRHILFGVITSILLSLLIVFFFYNKLLIL